MALCRTGYFWSASAKRLEKHPSEWVQAVLELVVQDEKGILIVHPNDPVYESVDEEDRTLKCSLEMYRRCVKLRRNRSSSKDTSTQSAKPSPKYQLLLQKRLLLKGHQLKIGFDDQTSQQQFYEQLKIILRGSKGDRKFKKPSRHRTTQKKSSRDAQRCPEREEENAVKDIDNFMTDNQIYEAHTSGAVKVRVIPTDLSSRLKISGIYLLEVRGLDILLLDYINLMLMHKWSFRSVRSFGYNASKLYLLTGSCCPGGRGLLCFFTEKGDMLMEHLVKLMQLAARDRRIIGSPTDQSATPSALTAPSGQRSSSARLELEPALVSTDTVAHSAPTTRASTPSGGPKRQLVSDLTTSLQTFLRPQCCIAADVTSVPENGSLERTAGIQKDATTNDLTSSEECITRDATETEEETTDDLSLTEMQAANAANETDAGFTTSSEADLAGQSCVADKAYVNAQRIAEVREDEEAKNGAAARGKRQSITKLGFRGLEDKEEAPSSNVPPTSPAGDSGVGVKPASLRPEQAFSSDDAAKESAAVKPVKHASIISNKDVQLIKWRDLPAKREYSCPQALLFPHTSSSPSSSSSTSSRHSYFSDRPTSEGPSRNSDIINFVLEQGKPEIDTLGLAGSGSPQSSSSRVKKDDTNEEEEAKKSSALLSDLVASTVF